MKNKIPPFRIGQGYDCHALVSGRKLIIGGVDIPHTTGLLGHSDADVLLHAITDAILALQHLETLDVIFQIQTSVFLAQIPEYCYAKQQSAWVKLAMQSVIWTRR